MVYPLLVCRQYFPPQCASLSSLASASSFLSLAFFRRLTSGTSIVLPAPDTVPGQHRQGNNLLPNGITQLFELGFCFDFWFRMNAVHQCTNRHRTLVMHEPRFLVCIFGLNVKNTAARGAGQWSRFTGCGFVSSDKVTIVGIREIAFHHSHASLLKHTARSTSRQSKATDDCGFWPSVSMSILIFFYPLQPDTAQAHSIPSWGRKVEVQWRYNCRKGWGY